ncbi:hypothetical protein WMF04_32790 [Sorangium sp. So ce260]
MMQGVHRKLGRVTSGTRLDAGPGEGPWLAAAPVLGPLPAMPGLQVT